MRINPIFSLAVIFMAFTMAFVIMPFLPVSSYAGERSIGKEEIKFEQEPVLSKDAEISGEKQEIVLTESPSRQKERLPARADIAATPKQTKEKPPAVEAKVKTGTKQAGKDSEAKIYEPIVNKLMEGIQLAAKDMRRAGAVKEKEENQPATVKEVRLKKESPPQLYESIVGRLFDQVKSGEIIKLAAEIENEAVNDTKKEEKSGIDSIIGNIIETAWNAPIETSSAVVKETMAIATVGTWDEMRRKKGSFNSEIGLASIKISKEDKPVLALTLKECIDIAVKNHLPLQIAKKSMRLAEVRVCEARRNLLPSASITMEESTGRVNARAYISKKTYLEGQQPIFHGGELYYNLKQAQANLEITRSDHDRIKNDLVLQVKKAYYSMAKAKDNFKIQKELSDEVAKINDMVNKEFESNIASKLEFLNVTSQSSQVKYQLASARGDISVAELILKQAMNIDTRDRIDVATLPPFKKIELDFENTLYAALVNRPEMRINSLMIDYYNYGKGIARAKGLPKVDLLGQWGMAKDEYMSVDQNYNPAYPFDDRKMSQQWYAGVKASMPLWGSTVEYTWTREQWPPQVSVYSATSSNTNAIKLKFLDKLDYYSDKKLAEIDYDKARQELIKIRQDVTLEVQEGCFNYEKALIQAETASNKVAYQAKDLEVTRFKRALDEAADSNVIESMIKLAQERFGYAQAVSDCHTTLAAINKAVGVEDYYKDE